MIIAIDFDGVICERTGIVRSMSVNNQFPKEGAKDAIIWLMKKGHELYIHSNRDKDDILDWLRYNNMPLLDITDKKKKGTAIYLDDRAFRFTSWQDFCKYLG